MSSRKQFLKQNADKKLLRLNRVLQILILCMTAIVLYDSVRHGTPLYYIGFYFAGLIFGRIFSLVLRVEKKEDSGQITLLSSRWNILITLLLLLLRFVFGKSLLESIHVLWAADALYLFFIGIYRSKWKGIVKQIDEVIYDWAARKNS